ncbi:hypothetical protein Xsto_04042 [Xenorhabdus stockiae]|uniref:Uncharacterized protein n=1 Tax=Xenorhabdus stockiae TaxID=351614 RepID=A0A2D0K803_9GAMM|nr:hypothetical protein [Xenorhabdus stockiae]PHM59574.1 hypothetical protein Xsto_04042 [Xenorhabdus stockiae]
MKYRLLFVVAALLFSSSYAAAQEGYWYEGCPKYSDEKIEILFKEDSIITDKNTSKLSKGELIKYIKEKECQIHNVEMYSERKKAVIDYLKSTNSNKR